MIIKVLIDTSLICGGNYYFYISFYFSVRVDIRYYFILLSGV